MSHGRDAGARQREFLVTGIGVISALGPNLRSFEEGLIHGDGGIRRLTLFDADGFRSPRAGEAPTPCPPARLGPFGQCSRVDRLALHAAEALDDAGLREPELGPETNSFAFGSNNASLLLRSVAP